MESIAYRQTRYTDVLSQYGKLSNVVTIDGDGEPRVGNAAILRTLTHKQECD